jgi:hypothetical protein
MVMGNNGINDYEKCMKIDGDLDRHSAGVIQRDVHRPMEHIPGFMQIH